MAKRSGCVKRLIPFLLFVAFLTGCAAGGVSSTQRPWAMKVNGYYVSDKLDAGWTSFKADDGYEWLVISLSVTNLTQEPQQLMLTDPFLSGNKGDWYEFMSGDSHRYVFELVPTLYMKDLVPISYKARQTQTENIAFQVLIGTEPEIGTLFFMSKGSRVIALDMSGVPELKK